MAKYEDSFLLQSVEQAYSSMAKAGTTPEYAAKVAESFGYTREQLESIPKESHMGLGCGNPTVTATLKPGEIVLDLGSGGGIDVFLAASKIGPAGKAVGIDMSADMVSRARANAAKRGLFPPNVSFIESSLTNALPINSNSIDCVLSNCVINLLPPSGKEHIFKEIYRVLKPGGRLVLDDILAKTELPSHIRDDIKQYVSCIGGAIQVHEYNELLKTAGFNEAATSSSETIDIDVNQWAASYQIYAMKPTQPDEAVCAAPLERWWDAFPANRSLAAARISPSELTAMIRNKSDVAIIDVRDKDIEGGRVKGSQNFPAHIFHNQLAAFHQQLSTVEAVVFYCGGSVGRAPRCAGW
ncbi:S-adenosyl-L-methionine-dependent methyltransferase [Mycena galericulata]|nr:S-adenosyl-L-methionine-dependent methyltransferase [Mycena galericulata]